MTAATKDGWQIEGLAGLGRLSDANLPAFEILYLDALAARLLAAGGFEQPYTVEHGAQVVAFLLQSVSSAATYAPDQVPEPTPGMTEARQSVLDGARDFAARGLPGLTQLVNRMITAAVGELEAQSGSAEAQVRSLFRYGLLALASGPRNELAVTAADGVDEVFVAWDGVIGAGFVPPWRATAGSGTG